MLKLLTCYEMPEAQLMSLRLMERNTIEAGVSENVVFHVL